MAENGLTAPPDRRAVIVMDGGAVVSLRLRKREQYGQKRSVAQGSIETGYRISDGTVTDQPTIHIEGIITGADSKLVAYNDIAASSEVASLQAAFNANELVSVYTSFIALADAAFTEFRAEMVPGKKLINITLAAQGIKFVNFSHATGEAPKKKVSEPKGKGTTNRGKQSVEIAGPPEEKHDLFYVGKPQRA